MTMCEIVQEFSEQVSMLPRDSLCALPTLIGRLRGPADTPYRLGA